MRVGSLVECIESASAYMVYHYPGVIFPEKGVVYTVRNFSDTDPNYIRLEEIINEDMLFAEGLQEPSFHKMSFRELQPPMDLSFVEEIQYEIVEPKMISA